jgi:hypothetical protein
MKRKYPIDPMGKPRMVKSDSWKKRPVVERYWAFKDRCRAHGMRIGVYGYHITFVVQMPKSWSMKKKMEMAGEPHQVRADVDNMLKAVLDACYSEDSVVFDIRVTKVWGWKGEIIIDDGGSGGIEK